MLQGLDLAESHTDRKTRILADGRLRLRGPAGARFFQGTLDDRFKVFLGKANGLLDTAIVISKTSLRGFRAAILPARVIAWGNMTSENEADDSGETEEQRRSKSARKREAASLQELGVKLSALPDQEIKALDLPDSLFVALRDLRRLPSHGAQVRQRQYIGKLMRNIDPEPVLAKLAERKQRHDLEIRHFQQIERWRDRLLSRACNRGSTNCCGNIRTPTAPPWSKLLEKAERERMEQRSPVGARELFAFLRAVARIGLVD